MRLAGCNIFNCAPQCDLEPSLSPNLVVDLLRHAGRRLHSKDVITHGNFYYIPFLYQPVFQA